MKCWTILASTLLCSATLCGDEIQTKDGKKIEFKILADQGDSYEVTTPTGAKVTIKKSDFEKIIPVESNSAPLTGATFTFDKKRKLEVVDLFTKIDLKSGILVGTWKFQQGALLGQADGTVTAKLESQYTTPEEFDLTMVVERVSGNDNFFVLMTGGGRPIVFHFDQVGGQWNGLAYIDNNGVAESGIGINGKFFTAGKARTIVFMVRKQGIVVQADGKDYFAWGGEWSHVQMHPTLARKSSTVLFGCAGGAFRITKAIVTTPKEKP